MPDATRNTLTPFIIEMEGVKGLMDNFNEKRMGIINRMMSGGSDSKIWDIASDYDWSGSIKPKHSDNIPLISLLEFTSKNAAGEQIYNASMSHLTDAVNYYQSTSYGNDYREASYSKSPFLHVYDHLYQKGMDTGIYILPYGSSQTNVSSEYTEMSKNTQNPNLIGNKLNSMADFANGFVGQTMEIIKTFDGNGLGTVFMEKSKIYQFPTNTPTENISFTLYNTVNGGSYYKNYCFLLGLIMKNLPYKISRSVYNPPVMYEAMVRGKFHYPWAAITNITVVPKGNIRPIRMDGAVTANIPEAWDVTINLTSLVAETGNTLMSSLNNRITVK